jgi:anti-sigma B factor antagonist
MSNGNPITAGPTDQGVRLTVEGRGTLVESQSLRELVDAALVDPGARVIIDLDRCDYLDSTFLGMLVGVHKRYGAPPSRYAIAASLETRRALFALSRLDRVLCFVPVPPAYSSEPQPLAPHTIAADVLGRHVVEAHRDLAQLGGAEADRFRAVADAVAAELAGRGANR